LLLEDGDSDAKSRRKMNDRAVRNNVKTAPVRTTVTLRYVDSLIPWGHAIIDECRLRLIRCGFRLETAADSQSKEVCYTIPSLWHGCDSEQIGEVDGRGIDSSGGDETKTEEDRARAQRWEQLLDALIRCAHVTPVGCSSPAATCVIVPEPPEWKASLVRFRHPESESNRAKAASNARQSAPAQSHATPTTTPTLSARDMTSLRSDVQCLECSNAFVWVTLAVVFILAIVGMAYVYQVKTRVQAIEDQAAVLERLVAALQGQVNGLGVETQSLRQSFTESQNKPDQTAALIGRFKEIIQML
jgi:hypothetical protein